MTAASPVKPRALRPGDTIAVVAPSGWVSKSRLAVGVEMLAGWDLNVRVMPGVYESRGYLAGTSDEANAAELTACFADRTVDGIICARGGYGAMRLLPFIDWQVVRANPKFFCGYSDITALHLAIRQETGLITFHGSMVQRQGDEPGLHPWSAAQLHRAILSAEPLGLIAAPDDAPVVQTLTPGMATGPLVGGNLTLVASLCGTRWQLDARDCILLLEDTDEAPYRVDRMLTQLLLAGVLAGVRGIVFGDSPTCEAKEGDPRPVPLVDVLRDRLAPLGVPLLYGFPCGHTPWRAALPLGVTATLDADAGTLTVLDSACVS
jgi:muramoyltetrapeptide carboxypeptidase